MPAAERAASAMGERSRLFGWIIVALMQCQWHPHMPRWHWIAEIRVSVLRFLGTLFSRTEGEKPSFHYFVEGSTAL
jgi:hypothetical protein